MTEIEALKARLRDDGHMAQRDGLAAMLATAHKAADAIERVEAENAKLRAELEAINSLSAQCEAENAKLREALGRVQSLADCCDSLPDTDGLRRAYRDIAVISRAAMQADAAPVADKLRPAVDVLEEAARHETYEAAAAVIEADRAALVAEICDWLDRQTEEYPAGNYAIFAKLIRDEIAAKWAGK